MRRQASRVVLGVAIAGSLLVAGVAAAQTIVTPDDLQGWGFDVAGNGTSAITGNQARNGDGSLQMNTNDGSGRIRFGLAPAGGFGLLTDVVAVGFDWFRTALDPTGSAPAHLGLALRLHVQDVFEGTMRSSELIWEPVYNGYPTAGPGVPTNAWQSSDLTGELFHRWVTGAGPTLIGGAQVNETVDWWASSSHYAADARVVGISIGAGSGWNGEFEGFADNVILGFEGEPVHHWNFELSAPQQVVPEPMSMALLGTGLAGLAAVRRRRRRKDPEQLA